MSARSRTSRYTFFPVWRRKVDLDALAITEIHETPGQGGIKCLSASPRSPIDTFVLVWSTNVDLGEPGITD
jgi:hypothetical protein